MLATGLRVASWVGFLAYITYLAQPGTSLFSWHPFLMALSFTCLMTEAVSIFTPQSLTPAQPHSTKLTSHWCILITTAITHLLGYATIYYNKEINNKPHLITWHGYLGLTTSILLWVQVTAGVFAKYPKLVERLMLFKTVRVWHSLSGVLVYSGGMVTICLGLYSKWFQSNALPCSFYLALCLHLVLLFGVLKRHVQRYVLVRR